MLAYFIRNFLISEVQRHPKPLIFQHFHNFLGEIGLRVGDIEHRHLDGRKPCGQGASMLLDQNSNETLQTAHNRAMQHDGEMAGSIFAHVFGVKALRHVRVDLNRAALPFATDRVFQRVFDLGAVESALARQIFKIAA